MDEKRQGIIEKILKLMSHTTDKGATKAEAVSAALLAQKMMNEYNIQQSELHCEEEEIIIDRECEIYSPKSFYKTLAAVIAPNFRCKAYADRDYKGHSKVHFYGYENDVDAAMITFTHLFTLGNRLANRQVREARAKYGTAKGVYNTFAIGFINGIQSELEKQSKALLIITPKEVEKQFIEDFNDTKWRTNRGTRVSGWDWQDSIYSAGKQAAIDGVRSRRLEGMPALEAGV